MTKKEQKKLSKKLFRDGIFRLKARKRKDGPLRYFLIVKVLKSNVKHKELQEILQKTFEPISLKDDYFGKIVWNRQVNTFDARFNLWSGNGN